MDKGLPGYSPVIGRRRPNLGRPPVYHFAYAHAEVNPVNVGFDHAA